MTRHHVGIVKQVVLPQANDLNQRASTKKCKNNLAFRKLAALKAKTENIKMI